jgi:hypothetical protein
LTNKAGLAVLVGAYVGDLQNSAADMTGFPLTAGREKWADEANATEPL